MNCWEHKACGNVKDVCPAYPERGMDCWKVTGTMCDCGKVAKASKVEKITFCRSCDFYVQFAAKY